MYRNLKVLGMATLLLMGIVAMNASTAQAKWLLHRNGQSVLLLALNLSFSEAEFLVDEVGLHIVCSGGSGTGHLDLNQAHTSLTASTAVTFFGCKEVNFSEVCELYGGGLKAGEILTKAEGSAYQTGIVDVTAEVISAGIGYVEFVGEECPLAEIDGSIYGTMVMLLLNMSTASSSHTIHLEEGFLYFGEYDLTMHSSVSSRVLGTATESSSGTWKAVTVGL